MTKHLHTLGLVFVFALASSAVARTQEAPQPSKGLTPLRIQLVISRYQGEKKVSSLPYTLSINATGDARFGRANLRMGAKVPVVSTSYTPIAPGGAGVNPLTSFQYQDVGTNIDCNVAALDDGRFKVEVTIDDNSIYPDDPGPAGGAATKGNPSFRSFRASDQMILKDGGTAQFTTATDKVSGEIVKVDVTLTVVK